MVNLFIDESGSITNNIYSKRESFFIIAVVYVKNKRALKSSVKRFVRKNKDELRAQDKNCSMFSKDGSFIELKGSCMSYIMKKKFINYISNNNNYKVYYVKLNNHRTNGQFTQDKERAYNYLLKMLLEYNLYKKKLPRNDIYLLHHDQRSIAVKNLNSLEDYLNITLSLEKSYIKKLELRYYESQNVTLIQVADIFANILFSNSIKNNYKDIIKKLNKENYIAKEFKFPL